MPTPVEIRAAALARGLAIKRNNALAAILFGGSLALLAAEVYPFQPIRASIGLFIGLLYANAFEYVFHRFWLHAPAGYLAQQHSRHHSSWGAPDEARYVNFARTPWAVVLLLAVNALPFFAAERVFRLGLPPGVLAGFVVYFVVLEEIHWRMHQGGRLPSWLRFGQRHHLAHHAGAPGRFNVFLPVFDWLSGYKGK